MLKVVITGASSGIGLALARHYLIGGASVAVIARRGDLLQNLATEFPEKVFIYPLDVRDALALSEAANDFMAQVGVPDLVIANAGVSRGTLTEYAEDLDVFQQILNINVMGIANTFQPFINAMRVAKSGRLVGIASVAGFRGLPGSGAYSASKAAAISYLESVRVELRGSGINVITLCPGYIKTPMTDLNPYRMPFILEVNEAVRRMARVIEHGSSFAVVPWQMSIVGWLLKILPNSLYDFLFKNAPHKPRNV